MLELESDSKEMIRRINDSNTYLGQDCFILDDIKSLLASFPMFHCSYIYRNINKATHMVANFSLVLSYYLTWMEEAPQLVKAIKVYVVYEIENVNIHVELNRKY